MKGDVFELDLVDVGDAELASLGLSRGAVDDVDDPGEGDSGVVEVAEVA